MAHLHCVVVTPEETSLDANVKVVALPLYDGEIGIAAGHSPMIGRLGFGEMRLSKGGAVTRYYVDGGFVQVLNDEISVLTNRAVEAESLDEATALEQLDSALQREANSEALMEIRDREISRARAQLRIAQRSRSTV